MDVWEIVADKPGREEIRNEVVLPEQAFRLTIRRTMILVATASDQCSLKASLTGVLIYAHMQKDSHCMSHCFKSRIE